MNYFRSKKITFIALSLVFVFYFLFIKKNAHGQSFFDVLISATIKIAVCGDLVVEHPEDCEGENLNGQTCQSLGLTGGTLACDIACEFDTYACLGTPTPTLTSTPTPSPTLTPTSTPTNTPSPNPTLTPTTSTPAPTNTPTLSSLAPTAIPSALTLTLPSIPPAPKPTPRLPSTIAVFDSNHDDHIALSELFFVVNTWVDSWLQNLPKQPVVSASCDLNNDGFCNLIDLSVLLYYIEP